MFQGLFNLHKLFSKRYFVVFFDKQNMPEEGNTITVGELMAEFKKEEDIKEKEENLEPIWICRKCGFREQK